uniref:C2H2-type domain-containing protein n=1 Tax=Lutzomyia longipalpis TaxID=7200 RepID=A0A1B0GKS6_LUTLO
MEIKTENDNLLDYSIVKSEYSLQEIQENNILAAVEVKDENEIKEEPEEMREAEVMGRKYTCKDCGKGFYSKDRYEKHLTVHSNVRKFQCSLCSNSFKLGLSLDQHLRFAHSSERPFSCTVCPGTFKYKQGLMQHMKSHERKLSLGSLRPCLPEKTEGEGITGQISVKSEAN